MYYSFDEFLLEQQEVKAEKCADLVQQAFDLETQFGVKEDEEGRKGYLKLMQEKGILQEYINKLGKLQQGYDSIGNIRIFFNDYIELFQNYSLCQTALVLLPIGCLSHDCDRFFSGLKIFAEKIIETANQQTYDKRIALYYATIDRLNSPDAMVKLADCYIRSEVDGKSLKDAVELYEKALSFETFDDMSKFDAMVKLADCYRTHEVDGKSSEDAVKLYWEAAELFKNPKFYNKKVIDVLNKLVELNSPDAMVKLADCYMADKIDGKGLEDAVKLYERAVELNNPDAMVKLADCYRTHEVDGKGLEYAVKLYERAVELNNPDAMVKLADCYRTSKVDEKGLEDAVELYEKVYMLRKDEEMLHTIMGIQKEIILQQQRIITQLQQNNTSQQQQNCETGTTSECFDAATGVLPACAATGVLPACGTTNSVGATSSFLDRLKHESESSQVNRITLRQ